MRVEAGELHIHKNLSNNSFQVWLYDIDGHWKRVSTDGSKVMHPIHPEKSFSLRSDGTPGWINSARFAAVRNREGRK